MSSFVKLVNYEVSRFWKFFVALIALITFIQITYVSFQAVVRVAMYEEGLRQMTKKEVLENLGYVELSSFYNSMGMFFTVALGVISLLIYTVFIWYRDWFSKQPLVFRLYTLPVKRMSIYYAKLATLLLFIFGLLGVQLILLKTNQLIVKILVPTDFRYDQSIGEAIRATDYLNTLLPSSATSFLMSYLLGVLFLLVIFTNLLFERSYKWVGMIIAGVYSVFVLALYFAPYVLNEVYFSNYLYDSEVFYLQCSLVILSGILSILISRYLITKKVTV